ncbi:unnamed protein product [Effrenium voratum]|uniref:Uncharacterized protein n=1 Tax=Effrenium voratum TaxID=2562239 RepID=A0AA36J2Q8_9DINO|nr:unnamed protein product [Effrenium voratum]
MTGKNKAPVVRVKKEVQDDALSTSASTHTPATRTLEKPAQSPPAKKSRGKDAPFPQDAKGSPLGTGCVRCVTAVTIGACKGWEEGCQILNDARHPEHQRTKKLVDECTKSLAKIEEGCPPTWKPPSCVESAESTGVMHYMDVGFVSDADIERLLGLTARQLGLSKPVSRPNEDGSGRSNGFFISLQDIGDLPVNELLGMRKTRVWTTQHLMHSEKLLCPDDQLAQEQGSVVFNFAVQADVQQRDTGLKSGGFHHLFTFADLQAKAAKELARLEVKQGQGNPDGKPGEPTEAEQGDDIVVYEPGVALGSMARRQTAAAKKVTRKAAVKKQAQQVEGDHQSMRSGLSDAGRSDKNNYGDRRSLADSGLQESDPDLVPAAQRLGFVPECFFRLKVESCFEERLGRTIFQANRVLKTLEDAKAAQAVVLRNRLKRCGWASSLQEACEQPSSADPARVKEAVCGLLAAGIELPFRINIYLFQLHANKAFRDIADAKGNAEVAAAIDRYAEMLSPLSNDPATQLDEFDPFHPKVACLVAQLLDEMSQVSTEKQTDECLAQALGDSMLNFFLNDGFVQLVQEVQGKGGASQETLAALLTALRDMFASCQRCEGDWSSLPDPVVKVSERCMKATSCWLTLLVPIPEACGLSVEAVLPFSSYKGSEILEGLVHECLVSKPFWQEALDQANKFAGTTKEFFPKLKSSHDLIAQLEHSPVDQDIGFHIKVLVEILRLLPQLQTKLRPSATDGLEDSLKKRIPPAIKVIVNSQSLENLPVDLLLPFLQLLEPMVGSDVQLADLQERLQAWHSTKAGEVAKLEAVAFLKGLQGDAPLDWGQLKQHLGQLGADDLDAELQTEVDNSVGVVFCHFEDEAGSDLLRAVRMLNLDV